MTQPTQKDLEKIATKLLAGLESIDGENWVFNDGFMRKKAFDPYNSNRFTGALVKAVFPLLAKRDWIVKMEEDGTFGVWGLVDDNVLYYVVRKCSHLNTALIEAWKKIEGEKK